MMSKSQESLNNSLAGKPKSENESPKSLSKEAARAELLTLLRLLVREPPPDHNFYTCHICKRYGITTI
jgi:hypothetical protein